MKGKVILTVTHMPGPREVDPTLLAPGDRRAIDPDDPHGRVWCRNCRMSWTGDGGGKVVSCATCLAINRDKTP